MTIVTETWAGHPPILVQYIGINNNIIIKEKIHVSLVFYDH